MNTSLTRKAWYCVLPLIHLLLWHAEFVRAAAVANDAFEVTQVTQQPVDIYTAYRISGDGKKVVYRTSTEITQNGRIYSLYLVNADGSGPPRLIDSTIGRPLDKDSSPVPAMLGVRDISYDGGKVLYSIYRYDPSGGRDDEKGYFIFDASTGSISEVGDLCIFDPLAGERCAGPSIEIGHKNITLSGDGKHLFFAGSGTINCTLELNSDTWVPDDYRWACPDDGDPNIGKADRTNLLRIMRVSADNPSNKDELVEWWSQELGASLQGTAAGYGYLADMETDHTGELVVLSKSNTEFYVVRGKSKPRFLMHAGSYWGGVSPEGQWMAFSNNDRIVASSLDKSTKSNLTLNKRFYLDIASGAKPFPLDISQNASWILVGGQVNQQESRYKLATVRRNGSELSPLPVYSYNHLDRDEGNSLSDDGNFVVFLGRDENEEFHLYVATRIGTCESSPLTHRASSNYDNLPQEAQEIMTDECLSDEAKTWKIVSLVEGWLEEYSISFADLRDYIIPTMVATKDLDSGYYIFNYLSMTSLGNTGTDYIETLAAELMESKLTSRLINEMDVYCDSRIKYKGICEESLSKAVLRLCSCAIAPPSTKAYTGLIEKAAKKVYTDAEEINKVKKQIASEVLDAEGFGTLGFVAFVGDGLLNLIPVGKVLDYLKKGYGIFSSVEQAYQHMDVNDVRMKEYTYTSTLDNKEYKITAAVMRVPGLSRLQILMARREIRPDGSVMEDEPKNTILENWPISIATVKTIGSEEYLVFNGGDTKDTIFNEALNFFKGFEKKGYIKAQVINRFDYP